MHRGYLCFARLPTADSKAGQEFARCGKGEASAGPPNLQRYSRAAQNVP
jgi:hypothetical protein